VITGADTAASWWRTQTMSGALTALADRTYKAWARDTNVVEIFGGADTVNDQLLAASLTANYVGDDADWRHLSALLGRDKLLRLDRHADPAEANSALETLRLAGDDDGLKRGVQHASGIRIAITHHRSMASTEGVVWERQTTAYGGRFILRCKYSRQRILYRYYCSESFNCKIRIHQD